MSNDSQEPITASFSDFVEKIENVPGQLGEALESVPSKFVDVITNASNTIDKIADATTHLAEPTKYKTIVANVGSVAENIIGNINTNELEQKIVDGASKLANIGVDTFITAAKTNPITGLPIIAMEKGTKAASQFVISGSEIVNKLNEGLDKTLKEIDTPMFPKTGQSGGAKTRRHLKKMIRERQLIQTRTNKMIHEFTNPNHRSTQNKKHIIKKTKRRRRRH